MSRATSPPNTPGNTPPPTWPSMEIRLAKLREEFAEDEARLIELTDLTNETQQAARALHRAAQRVHRRPPLQGSRRPHPQAGGRYRTAPRAWPTRSTAASPSASNPPGAGCRRSPRRPFIPSWMSREWMRRCAFSIPANARKLLTRWPISPLPPTSFASNCASASAMMPKNSAGLRVGKIRSRLPDRRPQARSAARVRSRF